MQWTVRNRVDRVVERREGKQVRVGNKVEWREKPEECKVEGEDDRWY